MRMPTLRIYSKYSMEYGMRGSMRDTKKMKLLKIRTSEKPVSQIIFRVRTVLSGSLTKTDGSVTFQQ